MNTPELELIGLVINYPHLAADLASIDKEAFEGEFERACHQSIIHLFKTEQDLDEYSIAQGIFNSTDIKTDIVLSKLGDAISSTGFEDNYQTVKKHLLNKKEQKDLKKLLIEATWKLDNGVNHNEVADGVLSAIISKPPVTNIISIKDASEMFFKRLEGVEKGQIKKIYTGLKKLDEHLGGIEPPDTVYIAARPSMGKTSLATRFLNNIAMSNKDQNNLIFSLETNAPRIAEKIHCQRTGVLQEKFINGGFDAEDWDRITKSAAEISHYNNILISEQTDITAEDVLAEGIKLNAQKKVGSVFLDFLQLLKSLPGAWSREREVAEQSRLMKVMAKKLGCPVFVLSQLNRSLESRTNKEPQLSDLRDSGSIEQDADIILFIYRDEMYNKDTEEKGIAQIIIAKNKRGRTGRVKVGWDGATTRFYDL
jgi:replicative DNA helicase